MIRAAAWTAGINWAKAEEVGAALLLSPLIGFVGAACLLLALKIARPPQRPLRSAGQGRAPPLWIRGVLMITCTLVSFFHGSNDGQKGMG